MQRQLLRMYAIFDSPADHPGKFVCREQIVNEGQIRIGELIAEADTLNVCRTRMKQKVRHPLVKLSRYDDDPPHLVEVWL